MTDSNGLSLELCLDGDGATGNFFFDPVVASNLFSEQIGFGAEAFWWLSEATIDTPTGLSAIIVMAAEAAFLAENPAPGEQFPFTRLRIRIDVPQPGVYTVNPNLRVRNNGAINAAVPATAVGVQSGQTVYIQTIQVLDTVGGGATAFNFPSHTVGGPGNITWTVTIVDGDADVDQATATTRVR